MERWKDILNIHDNNIYTMAENAKVQLNRLDEAVGHAMEACLKAVNKRYRTPFSPEMRQTRLARISTCPSSKQAKPNRGH
jgi:hypothetical protein